MKFVRILFILFLMMIPVVADAEDTLTVSMKSGDVDGTMDLGTLRVEGAGKLKFTASRDGKQVTVLAVRRDGTVAGKAETVVGLNETPLYVKTPNGLKRLTVRWKRGSGK